MVKKLKSLLLNLSVFGLMLAPTLAPVSVYAQAGADANIQANLCGGADELGFGTPAECAGDTEAQDSVNNIIATVINIFSVVVGVVAVIMIIFGGFKYITSGGDSGNISSAKNTILFAIVGLVIVALAQIVVRFVLARATETGA